MEITGFKSSVFTAEYGELKISGATAPVVISIADPSSEEELLHEQYEPDADGAIVIRDLGLAIQALFKFEPISFLNISVSSLKILFTATSGGEEFFKQEQQVFYSRARIENKKKFLSYLHNIQLKTRFSHAIGLIRDGQVLSFSMAYKEGNAIKALEHKFEPYASDGEIEVIDASVSKAISVAKEALKVTVTEDQISYYDYKLYDGETVIDRIRFYVDKENHRQLTTMAYYNAWGIPTTAVLTGNIEKSAELGGEFGRLNNRSLKVHTDMVEISRINSGYISTEERRAFQDLCTSPRVYKYGEGKMEEVTITDADFTYTYPSDEPLSVFLSFRKTDALAAPTDTEEEDDFMIFYDTFETTFV